MVDLDTLLGDAMTRVPHFSRALPPVPFREEVGNILDRSAQGIAFGVLAGLGFSGGFAKEADFYFSGAAARWAAAQEAHLRRTGRLLPLVQVWRAPAVYALTLGVDTVEVRRVRESLAALRQAVDARRLTKVHTIKLGCHPHGGALSYVDDVRPLFAEFLDERFAVLHRAQTARQGGRRAWHRKGAAVEPPTDMDLDETPEGDDD